MRVCLLLIILWGGVALAGPDFAAAEAKLAAGKLDQAHAEYEKLRKSGYLTADEKAKVVAGYEAIARARVTIRVTQVPAGSPLETVGALLQIQRDALDSGGEASQIDAVVRPAIQAQIDRAWPAVEARLQRGEMARAGFDALDLFSALAPLDKASTERRDGAVTSATVEHTRLQVAAQKPGAKALHGGLRATLGDPNDSPLAVLREQTKLKWQLVAGTGPCAAWTEGARGFLVSGAGEPATVTLDLTRCDLKTTESTIKEAYTWTEDVPYTVSQRVTRTVSTPVKKQCTTKYVSRVCQGHGNCRNVVVGTKSYDCSYVVREQVTQLEDVTKYRLEQRRGTRERTTQTHVVGVRGSAVVKWSGGELTVPITVDLTRRGSTWKTPQDSRSLAPDETASGARHAALGAISGTLREAAQTRISAAKVAHHRAAARVSDAEHHLVMESIWRGEPSAGLIEYAQENWQLEPKHLVAALFSDTYPSAFEPATEKSATRLVFVTPNDSDAVLENQAQFGRIGMGLRALQTSDLEGQPDRQGIGVIMLIRTAALFPDPVFMGEDHGPIIVLDNFMASGWLGGRTSESVKYRSKEESPLAGGLGVGYQLLLGVRGDALGLFVGQRIQWLWQTAGEFEMAGWAAPLVARAELKLGRYPIFVEAWGFPLFGAGDSLGGQVDFTIANGFALGLRASRDTLESRYAGDSLRDVIDLDLQAAWTADAAVVYQF